MIGNPFPLKANAKKSFQGSIVLGKGFVLSPEEAEALIAKDPRNKDVLFPYLNGDDLNNDPEQKPSRWVINFFDWSEEKAQAYPDCFKILEERVKPERQRWKTDENGNEIMGAYALRRPLPQRWWIYGEKRPTLYETISQLDQVMVVPLVSKYSAFDFAPTNIVYMHKLGVIVLNDYQSFAILSSTLHNIWCWKNSSTLGAGTLNYSTTACFETFPFPDALSSELITIGKNYYDLRKSMLKNMQIGLTKLYNLFHNKQYREDILIQKLRDFHVQMDVSILNVYGWNDISLKHDFYELEYLPENDRIRFSIDADARQEILKRLLILNHERRNSEASVATTASKNISELSDSYNLFTNSANN